MIFYSMVSSTSMLFEGVTAPNSRRKSSGNRFEAHPWRTGELTWGVVSTFYPMTESTSTIVEYLEQVSQSTKAVVNGGTLLGPVAVLRLFWVVRIVAHNTSRTAG